MVTHLTTNPPVRCLNRAERTGSLVFNVLWSYVITVDFFLKYELVFFKSIVKLEFVEETSFLVSACKVS